MAYNVLVIPPRSITQKVIGGLALLALISLFGLRPVGRAGTYGRTNGVEYRFIWQGIEKNEVVDTSQMAFGLVVAALAFAIAYWWAGGFGKVSPP